MPCCFLRKLYFLPLIFLFALSTHAQSWQAEIMTGWTSRTYRAYLRIHDNVHVGTSLSRRITPHWRGQFLYMLQGAGSGGFPVATTSFCIHNLSAGMIYEEPDERSPLCLFGGWLVGSVLYDPINPSVATEFQPVINTVMGVRGHIRPRIGYQVQGLFLMPVSSVRDRFFEDEFPLGAGPRLTQIAANVGVTYDF